MKHIDPRHIACCAAAELLDSRGWCQGSMALSANGNRVMPSHSRAVAFCLAGALMAVAENGRAYGDLLHALSLKIGAVSDWNDRHGRTKDEVTNLLRTAFA